MLIDRLNGLRSAGGKSNSGRGDGRRESKYHAH
jgi:hypothetical protein